MSIKIKIFKFENNENKFTEEIEQDLNIKFIDFKKNLLEKYFPENNVLEINNITERVYKDYGLSFFNLGVLPSTNDNYLLSKFTIPERTFSFLIKGSNQEKKKFNYKENKNKLNQLPKIMNFNKYKDKDPNEKKEFIMDMNDFPPLG